MLCIAWTGLHSQDKSLVNYLKYCSCTINVGLKTYELLRSSIKKECLLLLSLCMLPGVLLLKRTCLTMTNNYKLLNLIQPWSSLCGIHDVTIFWLQQHSMKFKCCLRHMRNQSKITCLNQSRRLWDHSGANPSYVQALSKKMALMCRLLSLNFVIYSQPCANNICTGKHAAWI